MHQTSPSAIAIGIPGSMEITRRRCGPEEARLAASWMECVIPDVATLFQGEGRNRGTMRASLRSDLENRVETMIS